MTPIAGIFVGGGGTRMHGRAKGLLPTPEGPTILERWRSILREAGIGEVVLVGAHPAYESLGLHLLSDDPAGIGPLGGLIALLEHVAARQALALACDMPFVSSALIRRLVDAPPAAAVAPRIRERWEPLCARYEGEHVLPLALHNVRARKHSLQELLDVARAAELPLAPEEMPLLRDWDTPEDVQGQTR